MYDNNPLTKYFRQPKIYLSLPSGGQFYPPGVIQGDPSKLPVFGMSAMDEILFKTPDGLFSGESSVQVIKSCIPSITNPWAIPSLDLDAIFLGIRIATYGDVMPTNFECKKCKETNAFDLNLSRSLDYLNSLEYIDSIIVGPLKVNFRPVNYQEITQANLKIYELRRQLAQKIDSKNEEDTKKQTKIINKALSDIANVEVKTFIKGILSVETEDDTVEDTAFIEEWLANSDKEFYDKIKEHLNDQRDKWSIKAQKVQCAECQHENTVTITLDNADFFARG